MMCVSVTVDLRAEILYNFWLGRVVWAFLIKVCMFFLFPTNAFCRLCVCLNSDVHICLNKPVRGWINVQWHLQTSWLLEEVIYLQQRTKNITVSIWLTLRNWFISQGSVCLFNLSIMPVDIIQEVSHSNAQILICVVFRCFKCFWVSFFLAPLFLSYSLTPIVRPCSCWHYGEGNTIKWAGKSFSLCTANNHP